MRGALSEAARLAAALAVLAAPALAATSAVPARAADLSVEVDGVEPGVGRVFVALCTGSLAEEACRIGQSGPAAAQSLRFGFSDVPPGTYAVAAFQDFDGDGRLGRTGLGLPTEPYGFSNGAGRRGRPDFASAAFRLVEPGTALRVRLTRALPAR